MLGIDLQEVWAVKSFRWFKVRIRGLLNSDSPIGRHFMPDIEPAPNEESAEG